MLWKIIEVERLISNAPKPTTIFTWKRKKNNWKMSSKQHSKQEFTSYINEFQKPVWYYLSSLFHIQRYTELKSMYFV